MIETMEKNSEHKSIDLQGDIRIEIFTPDYEDYSEIADLYLNGSGPEYPGFMSAFKENCHYFIAWDIDRLITLRPVIALARDGAGNLAGGCLFSFPTEDKPMFISALYTSDRMRGRGIASSIVEQTLNYIHTNMDMNSVKVATYVRIMPEDCHPYSPGPNKKAEKFFDKLNFDSKIFMWLALTGSKYEEHLPVFSENNRVRELYYEGSLEKIVSRSKDSV